MKAYRGSEGIAPLILNLGTRWRWVFGFVLRQNPGTHWAGGWVGPIAGLGVFDKSKSLAWIYYFVNNSWQIQIVSFLNIITPPFSNAFCVAVHKTSDLICQESFRLRSKPHMHHIFSFVLTGKSSSTRGFLYWSKQVIKFELFDFLNGSCREMRTGVTAEQTNPSCATQCSQYCANIPHKFQMF